MSTTAATSVFLNVLLAALLPCTVEGANLVKIRFFAGLSAEEAGTALGISAHRKKALGMCPSMAF